MKRIRSLAFAGLFVLSAAHAITITENFTNNPLQNGWQVFGDTNLVMTIARNNEMFVSNFVASLGTNFTYLRVDTISISSYSQAGQDTNDHGSVIYAGSILAHGTVDNFVVTLPPPSVQNLTGAFSNDLWQAQFISRSNWLYTLERTTNFISWTEVSAAASGNGTNLLLQDTNAPMNKSFYRVRAQRP